MLRSRSSGCCLVCLAPSPAANGRFRRTISAWSWAATFWETVVLSVPRTLPEIVAGGRLVVDKGNLAPPAAAYMALLRMTARWEQSDRTGKTSISFRAA